MAPAEAEAAGVAPTVFSVTDATGRSLGLLSLSPRDLETRKVSQAIYESPSGRVLVATYRLESGVTIGTFRDTKTTDTLVVWKRFDLCPSGERIPGLYVLGEHTMAISARKGKDPETEKRRRELSSWLLRHSPSLAKLLREAHEAALVSEGASLESPLAEGLFRTVIPMVPLYSVFAPPSPASVGPGAVLRDAGPDRTKRLLSLLKPDPVPTFAGPDSTKSWRGQIEGGRGERLGKLSLEWKTLGDPKAMVATTAIVDWSAGPRNERAYLMFFGPGGGYFGRIERRTGGDWSTVVTFDGFGDVEGDGWFAPYRVGDRYAKEGRSECVEVPPTGERERQQARSALGDAFRAAMARSGVMQAESEELLYRWQRVLNLPQLRASLPPLVPLAEILADTPIPVFRSEADEAWAGSVELKQGETR